MSATHLYRTLHNQNTKVWHRPRFGLYDSRGGVIAMTLKIPLTKITGGELFFWKTATLFMISFGADTLRGRNRKLDAVELRIR